MTTGLGEMTAGRLIDTLTVGGVASASIAVASTGVAYGNSFQVFRGMAYTFTIKLGGTGTKSVKVELEHGSIRPANGENAADTTNWCVPDNKAPVFANITDGNLHKNPYNPISDGYCRLKYTGLGANDASTVVSIAQCFVTKTF